MIDPQRIAESLESARRRNETIDPISSSYASFDVADAYEVTRRISAIRQASGAQVRGFKIGLTFVPAWDRIGVDAPFWAPIFHAHEQLDEPLICGDSTSPRLEPEVIVGMGAAVAERADVDEIASAVDWVALGFEVVDSHFPEWRASPPDLIADHGCHASLRVGRPTSASLDTIAALRDLAVELTCDAEVVEVGAASNVLGGPIEAIAELLKLPSAPRIRAGDVISTGSLTGRSHAVTPGQRWAILPTSSDRLASVELAVE